MPGPIFAPSPHVGVSCYRCGLEVALLPNGEYRCYTPDCRGRSQIFTPLAPAGWTARPHDPGKMAPAGPPWVGKGRKRK